ncbi:MAG TPA: sensor histidine kinase KdpD [Kofleriaceae bacterium]|nr:sensor histidine kinase KdpD [Kofleriaceae bacterium]
MDDDRDDRPDPDALLASVKAEETRAARARLKLCFGAAPGVGKTYAMLQEAGRANADGEDVVIGVVETHGRPETEALVAGLPIIPRRIVEHRGVRLDELDLDAALARKPTRILVDELAHTNAPGSKHVKRWQDVLELLDAGIEVHTTVNVQHIESLSDVIQQITGIRVRETVPDVVIERADQIELVDISPDELLARLAEGKVYVPEQAQRAVKNFFQKGNLLALRELALRRTAERVDAEVLEYRKQHGISSPWPTADRILVCVGPSPGSERLIRATKRIAEGLHASWAAAHVELLGAPPVGERDRERVESHLRLAEALGGEIVRLAGRTVAGALLEHAQSSNVTRIVAGKPTHARWRDLVRGSLLDTLIRGSGPIEIHVIAPIDDGKPPPASPIPREQPGGWAYGSAVLAIAAATGLGMAVSSYATPAEITMLYLIAIMLASLAGRGPSLVAASLAVAAFDFCFVPPRFTFAVSDIRYLMTFSVMFAAGLAISTLTTRLRRQERDALIRERHTAALLAFTRDIAAALAPADVAAVTVERLEASFPVSASVLVPESGGADEPNALVAVAGLMPLASQELGVVRWAFEHKQTAGRGTDTLPGARILAVPLVSGDDAVGVIAVQARQDPRRRGGAAVPLIEAIARQAGLALGRVKFANQAREATLRARTEEMRNALLSAVSHDLRTPLAVITGAATTLRDDEGRLALPVRRELLTQIVDDARRLERVLANLLSLTRVESGMVPSRELIPVEELVGAALTRMEGALGSWKVDLDVPSDLTVPVDPVLFEQVLINLIDNALKHGAPPLELRARPGGAMVVLEVADHGRGIPAELGATLFDKFVRASSAPGAGLGLAVVRAIVEAHGGHVRVENAPGGGARFSIELPADHPAAKAPRVDSLAILPVREAAS